MTQVCRGICERLRPKSFASNLRYKFGQKWCSLCALFFFTEDVSCPCCKTRLRSKPRNKRHELPRM